MDYLHQKRQIKTNDWQREGESKTIIVSRQSIQLNLSTTATLWIEESGHCKEVAVVGVENMSECMDWPLKIGGRCGEVAFSGSSKVLLTSSKSS